ncbi:MAG TPA: AMP-binding protein, partial [Pseudonocardiaceae bacterium]
MSEAGAGWSEAHGPPLVIGADEPRRLGGWLERAAALAPSAGVRVLLDEERSEFAAYPELLARAREVAAGLAGRGVRPGTHVVLQLPCSLDHVVGTWACVLAGALPVPVALADGPGPVLDKLTAIWTDLGRPPVLTAGPGQAVPLPGATVLDLSPGKAPDGLVAGNGPVALAMASSGSTGRPKIIPITHRGLLELGVAARERPGFGVGDVTFNWLPLDHSGAQLLFHLAAVFAGATVVHAPTGLITADPLRLPGLLERHAVTHAWWPNFGYRLLADRIAAAPERSWDLSGVRVLLSGGEQCTLGTVRAFLRATGRFGVTPATLWFTWGMTETTTAITYSRFDDPETVRDGRIGMGTPDPGATLRVVATDGTVAPEGVEGPLQVRSNRVAPGLAAFGWLGTGDLAVIRDGRVTITGRESDLIILYGKNHLAPDLEAELATADGVDAAVAACGVPSERTGTERLAVLVEAAPSAELAARVRAVLAAARGI